MCRKDIFCGYVVLKLHFRIFARFNRMFAIRISVGLGTGGLKLKTFLVTINLFLQRLKIIFLKTNSYKTLLCTLFFQFSAHYVKT